MTQENMEGDELKAKKPNSIPKVVENVVNGNEKGKNDEKNGGENRRFNTYEEQVKFYERRIRACHKAKQKENEADELCNLGILYYKAGKLQEAKHCHERHLHLAKGCHNTRSEKRAYCNLGCTFRRIGNVDRAIECYEEGLKLAKELEDRTGEGKLINNLANIYEQKGDFDRAVFHHQRRLKLAKELNDLDAESKSCASIGNIHHLLGNIRESIAYYERLVASLKFKLARQDKKAKSGDEDIPQQDSPAKDDGEEPRPQSTEPLAMLRRNSDSISVTSSRSSHSNGIVAGKG